MFRTISMRHSDMTMTTTTSSRVAITTGGKLVPKESHTQDLLDRGTHHVTSIQHSHWVITWFCSKGTSIGFGDLKMIEKGGFMLVEKKMSEATLEKTDPLTLLPDGMKMEYTISSKESITGGF